MALYSFCDTEAAPAATSSLPSEAVAFGGHWLDLDVPGFRTLYTSGRETYEADIMDLQFGTMDGATFLRKRILPRTIIVGYQIIAPDAGSLMQSFNDIREIMSAPQAQVRFHDELEKYYVGTCKSVGAPEPGRLAVKGEMEIYCPDPYKYARTPTAIQTTTSAQYGSAWIPYLDANALPALPTIDISLDGGGVGATDGYLRIRMSGGTGRSRIGQVIVALGSEILDVDPNAFIAQGSRLTVDCASGRIYINGIYAPQLGDIANDFDGMALYRGDDNRLTITKITKQESGPDIVQPVAVDIVVAYRELWL